MNDNGPVALLNYAGQDTQSRRRTGAPILLEFPLVVVFPLGR